MVSTWANLREKAGACKNQCYFVLAPGFTTPSEGVEPIIIGDGRKAQDINIDGRGQAVIDAHHKGRIFVVDGLSSLSITGVTMQNACIHDSLGICTADGGAIQVSGGHLELMECIFKDNKSGNGGALYVSDDRPPHADDDAYPTHRGSATITSCTFEGNTSPYGGAMQVFGGASVTIISSTFKGGAGENADSVFNGLGGSEIIFACPAGTKGIPVRMKRQEQLQAGQLPPAGLHCSPK
jgi:hypothetical protein